MDTLLLVLSNQVAFDLDGPKYAVVRSHFPLDKQAKFELREEATDQVVFSGIPGQFQQVQEWDRNVVFTPLHFSAFHQTGKFRIVVHSGKAMGKSAPFLVGKQALARIAFPAILGFFQHQRANSPEELEADQHLLLYGSDKRVDLHGGWCDASGDVSKYFSHLAYTNYMSPQQIPLTVWAMVNSAEEAPSLWKAVNGYEGIRTEALYGADYLMRSLSPEGFFYMTVFSYFQKDPSARRVVGLLADSKTTSDYACAWREGGGMAIAALARISAWGKSGDFTAGQYLEAAERAFNHLMINSTRYADDGRDNIIDDYCALLAATELWRVTHKAQYAEEARKRSSQLIRRFSSTGYFVSNDSNRPFWHASDAGLPLVALARYLSMESDQRLRGIALDTIRAWINSLQKITTEVANPFGYPRQHFLLNGTVHCGFFIPHKNESGWWWQGEDARLGSLATALLLGGRLVEPTHEVYGVTRELSDFASHMLFWVLGCNPFDVCMMYGYGQNNVPYMASMYGHGTGKGGISNGITGLNEDGSGIAFKVEDNGNEWRWSEQWIPHSTWFLLAMTALVAETNPE
ncbi:MAG: glycoside hydrolase family 9 protein [Marinilabiliales bacterium]|nr:glycoside hydrolase family 9 protein [Marinilabiliales bacterium]